MATRSEDGIFAVVFAYDELENEDDSPLNIALVVFDGEGNLIEQLAGPDVHDPDQWVNDPSKEDPSSEDQTSQVSPAVAFVGDDIVVAWAGPDVHACQGAAVDHIYARRFRFDINAEPGQRLRDPVPAAGEGRAGMFIVDNDADAQVFDPLVARPSVALTLATGASAGRFVVAWNGENTADDRKEIRAQYFDAAGQPRGRELRVNQTVEPTFTGNQRYLYFSGQHTITYGAEDQVVATWYNSFDGGFQTEIGLVSFTLLPPNYARTSFPGCDFCQQYPELCDPCLKGDINGDCAVDGFDIQPFVDRLLAAETCVDIVTLCSRDLDNDGAMTESDIPCFVATLLMGFHTCELPPQQVQIIDCNGNEIPDDEDIAEQTSSDVNTNDIPDECEGDCNTNGVPDDWDIAQQTSADCNTNGYPDECELDCNSNGVPDDCDVDPTDPDGDEWVSPDCNGDEYPDECNLSLPPSFGSFDCNTNGIPDECDIAACESDPACDDCNGNGIPDACDIAAEISEDVNTNGIPDECEGEGLMGGGGSEPGAPATGNEDTGETFAPPDEDVAWEAFYEWASAQCWGPACESTTAEQFHSLVAKLRELGLPIEAAR